MDKRQPVRIQDYAKIGRYQSWLEDGQLKLYCHRFGAPSGMSCKLSPEETKELLEMLTRHKGDIDVAVREHDYQCM
jgi:hypothetical protein